jgi:hypothetical protein
MGKKIPVKESNKKNRQQVGKKNPPQKKKKQVRENERGIANLRVNVRCVGTAIEHQVW